GGLSTATVAERRKLGERITGFESELRQIETTLEAKALFAPNPPLPDVPDEQTLLRSWGTPAPKGGKPHWELAETLGVLDLPLGYVAYTPCFRREAGAAGKDTRGLLRIHQFDKVELVRFCRAADSPAEHEKLTGHAEEVLRRLELPYRVAVLPANDFGFAAAKTYDLEAWAPGVGQWLEVSSSSTFTDFQARRANIRCRPR